MTQPIVYDVPESIVAYRCWKITEDYGEPRLTSLAFPHAWSVEMTALPCHEMKSPGYLFPRCDGPPCHGVTRYPTKIGCGCGIYAVKSLASALLEMGCAGVVGKVRLAGKIWPHKDGYRSEKARIVGLYSRYALDDFKRWFEHQPFRIHGSLELVAAHHSIPLITLDDKERHDVLNQAQDIWVQSVLGRVQL